MVGIRPWLHTPAVFDFGHLEGCALLGNRNALLVVAARFVSRVGGTAVFFIGVWGVAAYSFRASARTLACVMAGNSIAAIIGSVAAGVLGDRVGPRRVLLGA